MADRLISADALLKEMKFHHDCIMQDPGIANTTKWWEAVMYHRHKKLIDEATTVDAVEVVRCIYRSSWDKATVNEKGFLICPVSGMEIMAHDYCSYGERKDDD